jgi:2'-5' RNA ligase
MLSKLHEDMCEAVGELSLGHMMPYHAQKLRDARTPVTLERTLMKYGFSCAGKLFDQHITLGRLKNPLSKDDCTKAERTLRAQTLKPTHIVVGRLGKHGDIIEVLNRFELP